MSSKKPNLGARALFKWAHTWVGLVAGLIIAIVSLTGSVIVFRNDIEQSKLPKDTNTSKTASLDDVALQVAQSHPGVRIRRVRFPEHAGDPYVLQVDDAGTTRRLVSEASTGRIVGKLESGWVEWTIDLHRNLLSGKTGRNAVGVVGVVLFTLAASGMFLWLSGARKWKAWISVRPQGGSRRFHFELHRAAGLWSYALLSLVAFSGIWLAYPDQLRSALQSLTGQPATIKAPKVAKSEAPVIRPLSEYLRVGTAAMADGVPTELRLPDGEKGPVDLRLWRSGDLSQTGNHVYIEPSTGRVLAVSRIADQPLATRISASFSPLHYGEFGGLPIKIVWGLLGLMPSVLFVTGLMTWWPAKRRKPATVVPEEAPVAVGAGR
jgi:uncharacterized iron-regulated membrane protein